MKVILNTVFGFNLGCLKFRCTAPLEGICATLNLRIQVLKLCIYYFIDNDLKVVILALS